MHKNSDFTPVACITGGARRIGKAITEQLHANGYDVIVHYQTSYLEAHSLVNQLNHLRPQSANYVQGDLEDIIHLTQLANDIMQCFGRLNLLVHNASRFYPTPLPQVTIDDWENLFRSNAQAPLLLTQSLLPYLRQTKGNIVSILDIHADNRPFEGYSVYNMAKAAHRMMVQSLALDLAPDIRVNGVAPGVNILPEADTEQALDASQLSNICARIPLNRIGTPEDIAQAVAFLASAPYITGQIIAVDGGRSLTLAS